MNNASAAIQPTLLSHLQARSFYDAFGERQDTQGFYEDPALDALTANAEFHRARAVFEFGCGTGRYAEELLGTHLIDAASYMAVDLSATMVRLSNERLTRFKDKIDITQTSGETKLAPADRSIDRFVANYVFDLLPDNEIAEVVAEAERMLTDDGMLCLVSLAKDKGLLSGLITGAWQRISSIYPQAVGGRRPLELKDYLPPDRWQTLYSEVVTSWFIPSEVLIAKPRR